MKKTTFPKTKLFALSTKSFCILLSTFKVFLHKEHSQFFKDFVMSSPDFQALGVLADFEPLAPVKGVKIIIEYE